LATKVKEKLVTSARRRRYSPPHARLILDASGNLYGTTSQGGVTGGARGNFGCGVAFELAAEITPPDFVLHAASSNLTEKRAGQVSDVITVAAQNGAFASAVQLSCALTGPSPQPSCGLSPTSVTPGANSVRSTLTLTAPAGTAILAIESQFNRCFLAMLLPPPLLGVTLIAGAKKEQRHFWALCAFLLLLSGLQMGCGGGSSSSERSNQGPMNYTVTVTGAANAGAIRHTTQITLTVQ
jgi:hypothetical protein